MKKLISVLLAMVSFMGVFLVSITPAQAGTGSVDICHATGNGKYVPQTVSKDGTANGHAGNSHQDGLDIIPAFDYIKDKTRFYFDGQNLDKAYLLDQGCKENAVTVTANPKAPHYSPANCANPNLPYGQIVLSVSNLGEGVKSASAPILSEDKKTWTVTYNLMDNTDETIYSWKDGETGIFTFSVVPLSEDPLWVVDSKTGEGRCELSNTGAGMNSTVFLYGAGAIGLGLIVLAGATFINRRNN